MGRGKRLLLDMAREHTLPNLLRLVVDRLAESPRVALARFWLVQSTDDCTGCPRPAECPDRSTCLHLVASSGRSAADPRVTWIRLDGACRRFPLGARKVGVIATGEPLEIPDLSPGGAAANEGQRVGPRAGRPSCLGSSRPPWRHG